MNTAADLVGGECRRKKVFFYSHRGKEIWTTWDSEEKVILEEDDGVEGVTLLVHRIHKDIERLIRETLLQFKRWRFLNVQRDSRIAAAVFGNDRENDAGEKKTGGTDPQSTSFEVGKVVAVDLQIIFDAVEFLHGIDVGAACVS